MCGIAGIFGQSWKPEHLEAMVTIQRHRGPDADGIYLDKTGIAGLGHNRLNIIDLSSMGNQPMTDAEERYWIVFNGEIYNYLELREELSDSFRFRTRSDTEVLLASYQKWGTYCLDRLIGMFSFAIWDEKTQCLFAARDRFGVKPLYYYQRENGTLLLASEIKALKVAGAPTCPDSIAWATYLAYGLYDHTERTFWKAIRSLPPGHILTWHENYTHISCWYNLAERVGTELDHRPIAIVQKEYLELLSQSVSLRFRSDVPVGINLSGGLDSSTLLKLVQKVQGPESNIKAFTFITDDPQYDELPWVREMLAQTCHPSIVCCLTPEEVPALSESIQAYQDEPFGGLPTIAYAKLFDQARAEGVTVLLDGNGMDEQWAGYDYYTAVADSEGVHAIQGTKERSIRPQCLTPEFYAQAENFKPPRLFPDEIRNRQWWDTRYTKIPRALRFNDRISMRSSRELREPFLDHRLFELAFRQPIERKISGKTQKWFLRTVVRDLMPQGVSEAPKRPLQTPQREWLRGALREWATDMIEKSLSVYGDSWLDKKAVRKSWQTYCQGAGDNSFFVWQWVSLGLIMETAATLL